MAEVLSRVKRAPSPSSSFCSPSIQQAVVATTLWPSVPSWNSNCCIISPIIGIWSTIFEKTINFLPCAEANEISWRTMLHHFLTLECSMMLSSVQSLCWYDGVPCLLSILQWSHDIACEHLARSVWSWGITAMSDPDTFYKIHSHDWRKRQWQSFS